MEQLLTTGLLVHMALLVHTDQLGLTARTESQLLKFLTRPVGLMDPMGHTDLKRLESIVVLKGPMDLTVPAVARSATAQMDLTDHMVLTAARKSRSNTRRLVVHTALKDPTDPPGLMDRLAQLPTARPESCTEA